MYQKFYFMASVVSMFNSNDPASLTYSIVSEEPSPKPDLNERRPNFPHYFMTLEVQKSGHSLIIRNPKSPLSNCWLFHRLTAFSVERQTDIGHLKNPDSM